MQRNGRVYAKKTKGAKEMTDDEKKTAQNLIFSLSLKVLELAEKNSILESENKALREKKNADNT